MMGPLHAINTETNGIACPQPLHQAHMLTRKKRRKGKSSSGTRSDWSRHLYPLRLQLRGGEASLPLAPISNAGALSRRVRRRSVNSSRCSLRWKEAPSAIAHGGHLNAEQDAKAAHALSTGIELEATKRWKKQVPHIGSMPLSVTQRQWAAFDLNSRRSI